MQSLRRRWINGTRPARSWTKAATTLCVVVLFLQSHVFASAKEDWLPIDPQELAETAPQFRPGAAAEVLELKVDVDDRDEVTGRVRREYLRAKIYKPDEVKPEPVVSDSDLGLSNDNVFGPYNQIKVRARLTMPDGTSTLFNEKDLQKGALDQTKRKGLADQGFVRNSEDVMSQLLKIGAVKAGAILEYDIERNEAFPIDNLYSVFTIQRRGIAIRKARVVVKAPSTREWISRYYVLNRDVATCRIQEDHKQEILTLEASEVAPVTEEPQAGLSYGYCALSLMSCYERKERNFRIGEPNLFSSRNSLFAGQTGFTNTIELDKTGPWSLYSISEFRMLQDYVDIASAIRQLTKDVVGDAKDQAEKAHRIHDRVQSMYAAFLKKSRSNNVRAITPAGFLDGLISYHRSTPVHGMYPSEPLILAMALYKAAGLESRMILLPDRRVAPFDRNTPSHALVPYHAVQVKLGDQWVYSMPVVRLWRPGSPHSLPFGEIPWYCEGQVALLVKEGSEEFISVPFSDSSKSVTGNTGAFELSADGILSGEAKRTYTGHGASALRTEMFKADSPRQHRFFAASMKADLKGVGKPLRLIEDEAANVPPRRQTGALFVKSISGLDTPETPIEIDYRLTLPSFAKVAGQRLIFPPWFFHAGAANPFTNETRTHAVYFPYALQELDSISIKLPPGYKPEFAQETLPPSGQTLRYQTAISFDEASNTLKLRREYVRNAVTVPVSAYGSLRSWYKSMTRIDRQEVAALSASATPGELPATAASAAPTAAEQPAPDSPAVPPAS